MIVYKILCICSPQQYPLSTYKICTCKFYISSLAKEELSRLKEARTHAYKQALRVNKTILLAQQAQVLHTQKDWIYLFSLQNESIDSDDISWDIGVYNGILESTISSNDIEYSAGAKAYFLIQKKMARMWFRMTSPIYEFLNEQPAISLLAAAFFTKETTPEEIIQIITATIQENIDEK